MSDRDVGLRLARPDGAGNPTHGMSAVGWWLGGFVGIFLMMAAWAVAAPYNGTPDEYDHMVRAAGVAGGQIASRPVAAVHGAGGYQTIPAGLVRDTTCWIFRPTRSAACARPPGSDRTPRRIPTGAGRYQPVYYALVGWPLRLWPGWSGVLLSRLVSGALSAALLASALVVVLRHSRRRFLLAGFIAVLTPMAVQMGSAVNPSGLEIAAGITLFASAIPLLRGGLRTAPRGLLALAGTSAVLIAVLRTTGPLYVCLALGVLALPVRRRAIRRALAIPAVRRWLVGLAAALFASAAWILLLHETDLGDYRYGKLYTRGQALMLLLDKWRGYLDEMVGVTSWLDTRMAMPTYMVWEAAAGTLVVGAVVVGHRSDRWRLLALAGTSMGIPTLMQMMYVRRTGFILQGRYMLPMLAGVVLLAAYTLDRRLPAVGSATRLVRVFTLALLPVQLISLSYTMARWQNGLPGLGGLGPRRVNPLAGDWHPLVGSAVPLLIEISALVLLGMLYWRAARVPDAVPATAGEHPNRGTVLEVTVAEGAPFVEESAPAVDTAH